MTGHRPLHRVRVEFPNRAQGWLESALKPSVLALEEDGGNWFVTGAALDTLSSTDAHRAAVELMRPLNLALNLAFGPGAKMDVKEVNTVVGGTIRTGGAFLGGRLTIPRPEAPLPELAPDCVAKLMATAGSDAKVAKLLDHWFHQPVPDLRQYYVILEQMEVVTGQTVDRMGWCSASERERFTATSNNEALGGLSARHPQKGTPPKPTKKMEPTEVHDFIYAMARKLIKHLTD